MSDNNEEKLERKLSARHMKMIALGGTIGVGLFMGAHWLDWSFRITGLRYCWIIPILNHACIRRNAIRSSRYWIILPIRFRILTSRFWIPNCVEQRLPIHRSWNF